MRIAVSIIEDDDQFRQYLAALIQGAPGFSYVGAHPTAEKALKHVPSEKPDVLLVDLELPGMSGIDCIPRLKARLPTMEILVLTICDDSKRIFAALEAGASGYLLKPPTSSAGVLNAIAEVQAGGSPMSSAIARLVVKTFQRCGRSRKELEQLSPREEEILGHVVNGSSTKEIADQLSISPRTVSTHLHNIYEKLHVRSRAEAAVKYLRV